MRLQPVIKPILFLVIGVGFLIGNNYIESNKDRGSLANQQDKCHISGDKDIDNYLDKGETNLNQGNYQKAIVHYIAVPSLVKYKRIG